MYDAMRRKAAAGRLTGGRVFGYDNHEVLDGKGDRSHVERRINEAQAAVVRRIFVQTFAVTDILGLTLRASGVTRCRETL